MILLFKDKIGLSNFLLVLIIGINLLDLYKCEVSYNVNDPDCTGKFGRCTPSDKRRLGYSCIKKLHEKMDEDKDGGIEIQETKEFIKEDLKIKNNEHEKKFHGSDGSITVEELWKSWEHSVAYNWTTDDMVLWLNDLNLQEYTEHFRRNHLDGQFLPRLFANDNHYFSNVLNIRDQRHKHLLIIKATDVILFGVPHKPHNLIKDVIMIGALTLSIFICIYLYTQHRKSSEQIKLMLIEFDKLSTHDEKTSSTSNLNNNNTNNNEYNEIKISQLTKRPSQSSFGDDKTCKFNNEEEELLYMNNNKSRKGSNSTEADENSLYKLQQAEQELEKMRIALKQNEARLDIIKYQAPMPLLNLLNKAYESEKALLDYKLSMIEKDKCECVEQLTKVCRRQSGFMGALKIAHSSTLEEIQQKLEGLKLKHHKLKSEKSESTKRWNNIFEMCVRNDNLSIKNQERVRADSTDTVGSQDIPYGTSNSVQNLAKKFHRQDQLRSSDTAASLGSYELITQNGMVRSESSKSKYTSGDGIFSLATPNIKYPSVSKIDFNRVEEEPNNNYKSINNSNNNTEKYTNGNITDNNNRNLNNSNNKLIIISPSNLPQQPSSSPQHSQSYGSMPNSNGKIQRDSLIHVTSDVFQFSDVESVQTADFFMRKNTPQSSFESDDTYKSNSIFPALIQSKNNKKYVNHLNPEAVTPTKEKISFLRSSFSKLSPNSNEKGTTESLKSLENNSAISRTLSSLKIKIFSSNRNIFNSQTIKSNNSNNIYNNTQSPSKLHNPEILITPSVNSMGQISSSQRDTNKQLTINNLNISADINSNNNLLSEPISTNSLSVSMPTTPNSPNSSFTIQNSSTGSNISQNNSPATTPILKEKSNSIFNFKTKGKKSKSPKKRKN